MNIRLRSADQGLCIGSQYNILKEQQKVLTSSLEEACSRPYSCSQDWNKLAMEAHARDYHLKETTILETGFDLVYFI